MAVTWADTAASLLRRQIDWARRVGLERKLALALLVMAVASGLTTYGALTNSVGALRSRSTIWLLLIDLIVLLLLGTVLARRLVALWAERRSGLAGARLHARMVLLFSLAAVTPTIIVAVFTTLFLNYGINTWFSDRVSTAVNDSLLVAQAYLQEHQQRLGDEALAMASDLQRQGPSLEFNRAQLAQLLSLHAELRQLDEAAVIDGRREILANANLSIVMAFSLDLPDWAFNQARAGQVVILPSATGDRVRALVQLDPAADTFLYVGRLVDPKVLGHVDKASSAAQIYQDLESRRSTMQITFAFVFAVVALLVLCAAIWLALVFSAQLARPLGLLADAAERVRSGDLSVRVEERAVDGEVGGLSRAFNRMTSQLESQRARADRGECPARRAPAVHRAGAGRRFGRRHRPRPGRPDRAAEPVGPRAAGRRSRPVPGREAGRGRAGDGAADRSRDDDAEAVGGGAGRHRARGQPAHASGAGRRRARRGGERTPRRHLRRRDRAPARAAQGGLGGCGPAHCP